MSILNNESDFTDFNIPIRKDFDSRSNSNSKNNEDKV